MRVLIDERAVRALKRYLTTVGLECLTVQEVGWTGKRNDELLSLAEASFDRMLTLGTNLLSTKFDGSQNCYRGSPLVL
jgi:hypothetical protein